MTSLSDSRVFSQSMESQLAPEQFTSKVWSYITDQNNKSYNGTITFDCSSIANNGRWVNWRESYFSMPYILGIRTTVTDVSVGADAFDSHSVAFKSGFHHLLDSMSIELGNNSVMQNTPFSNMFNHYKILSTWSNDSYVKFGGVIGLAIDTPRSLQFVNATAKSLVGKGLVANELANAHSYVANVADVVRNEGFYTRSSYHVLPAKYPVITATSAAATGRTRWTSVGAKQDTLWYAEGLAIIRLSDVSDFINKLPLLKGSFLKFTLTTNTAVQSLPVPKAADDVTFTSASLSLQGRTVPFMVSQQDANSPQAGVIAAIKAAGADDVIVSGVGISSLTLGTTTASSSLQGGACRLYVPSYLLEPAYESQYLESFPVKEIVYTDVYNYVTSPVANDGDIQALITNGIVDGQFLVVVPIVEGAAGTAIPVSPHQSVYASEPGTTSAGCSIDKFNVQVSGTNIFQQDEQYDFEQFLHEQVAINALNGAQDSELTSGLISYEMWSFSHRYYVADLSRGSPSDGLVPKSVLLLGQNKSGRTVRYYTFVAYNRRLVIRPIDSTVVSA